MSKQNSTNHFKFAKVHFFAKTHIFDKINFSDKNLKTQNKFKDQR